MRQSVRRAVTVLGDMSNSPTSAAAIPRGAWRTLAITSAVVFMVSLEITVIALALPEIREAFPEASDSTLSWILTVYNIGVASLLLLSGWWADKSGRKKVFLIGLTFFAFGSVIAALAPNIELLIAARAIQSIGGAIQYPAGLALLLPAFPVERRQMAIGIWGAMGALAAALGPSVGAVLVNALGWRSIFGINVPVAVLAIIVGRRWLDESKGEVPEGRVDMIGVPLASLGVGAIILASCRRVNGVPAPPHKSLLSALALQCSLPSCGGPEHTRLRSLTSICSSFDPSAQPTSARSRSLWRSLAGSSPCRRSCKMNGAGRCSKQGLPSRLVRL